MPGLSFQEQELELARVMTYNSKEQEELGDEGKPVLREH